MLNLPCDNSTEKRQTERGSLTRTHTHTLSLSLSLSLFPHWYRKGVRPLLLRSRRTPHISLSFFLSFCLSFFLQVWGRGCPLLRVSAPLFTVERTTEAENLGVPSLFLPLSLASGRAPYRRPYLLCNYSLAKARRHLEADFLSCSCLRCRGFAET